VESAVFSSDALANHSSVFVDENRRRWWWSRCIMASLSRRGRREVEERIGGGRLA